MTTMNAERALAELREIDTRESDGLSVSAYWNPATNRITVAVLDHSTFQSFAHEEIPLADYRLAFDHPYAYSPSV